MPNSYWRNPHKGDTSKGGSQTKKAESKTTTNTYGSNPKFATGLDSEGNQNQSFGHSEPGKVKP